MCLQELTYLSFCYKFKIIKTMNNNNKTMNKAGNTAQWYSLRSNFGALGLEDREGSRQVWWCTPVCTHLHTNPQ